MERESFRYTVRSSFTTLHSFRYSRLGILLNQRRCIFISKSMKDMSFLYVDQYAFLSKYPYFQNPNIFHKKEHIGLLKKTHFLEDFDNILLMSTFWDISCISADVSHQSGEKIPNVQFLVNKSGYTRENLFLVLNFGLIS